MNPFEKPTFVFSEANNELKKDNNGSKKKIPAVITAAVIGLSPMAAKSGVDMVLGKPPQIMASSGEAKPSKESHSLSLEPVKNIEDSGKNTQELSRILDDLNEGDAMQERHSIEQVKQEQRNKDAQAYADLLKMVKQHSVRVDSPGSDFEKRLKEDRNRVDASLPDIGGETVSKKSEIELLDIHRVDVTSKNVDGVVESFRKDFGIDTVLDAMKIKTGNFIDNSETINVVTKAIGVDKVAGMASTGFELIKKANQTNGAREAVKEINEVLGISEKDSVNAMGELSSALENVTPGKLLAGVSASVASGVLNRETNRFILKAVENSRNAINPNTVSFDTRFQNGLDARHPDNMLFQKNFNIESGEQNTTVDDLHITIGADPIDKSAGIVIEKKF